MSKKEVVTWLAFICSDTYKKAETFEKFRSEKASFLYFSNKSDSPFIRI